MAAERDPRWWKVDDDPLEAHHRAKSHQAARDDGNWRQRRIHVRVGSEGRVFSNLFADARAGEVSLHKGSIWHFSSTEIRQLMLATGAFTLALALMFNGGIFGISSTISLSYAVCIGFTSVPHSFCTSSLTSLLRDTTVVGLSSERIQAVLDSE